MKKLLKITEIFRRFDIIYGLGMQHLFPFSLQQNYQWFWKFRAPAGTEIYYHIVLSVNVIFVLPEAYYPWFRPVNIHPEQQHE